MGRCVPLVDVIFLEECIRLAEETSKNGNPPFAAVLVFADEIILRAKNTQITDDDFSAHAEFNLLKLAVRSVETKKLRESIIYCSNEPCPMCVGAIYWSGIRNVVYGCRSHTLTKIRGYGWPISCDEIFSKASEAVKVFGPLLEGNIIPLLEGFYCKKGG